MRIAIIGTGHVGGAIARGLHGKGHDITFGIRDPGAPGAEALAFETGAGIAPPSEASAGAEIVVLAMPWAAAESAVAGLGDLAGKIVIDCMNPLGMVDGALALTLGHSGSGGETVQAWLPGARVLKTLNQVGLEILAANADLPHRPGMFMAGEDREAKTAVARLLHALGFAPEDAGGIVASRLLEPFAMLWITQAVMRGKGRDWAFAIVNRTEEITP
ncbi:NADPH-dependent F420 reductase [Jannaschia formosa]|uniref:NADPH-dependent F420 reductase n=1 Tax=Jannaschia formosa TaxID=2259592 RepID=UPI00142F4042|nr:NAD(P)-binding domain-containing protein [Jannaschia formosa]